MKKYSANWNLWIYLFVAFIEPRNAYSQLQILKLDEFIGIVKKYHPVAAQSTLELNSAEVNNLSAKARFDPNLYYDKDLKTIDGKDYYSYQNFGFTMYTKSPISIRAGHDNATGEFTNPEYTIGGITYLGVNIALLNGLAIDERRAALQQAKVFTKQSALVGLSMINDLLLAAHIAYYKWTSSYHSYQLLNEFALAAKERLTMTQISQSNGDRSVADTLEAAVQLQYFQLQLSEYKMKFINESLQLSSFLWTEDGKGYLLDDFYIPDTSLIDNAIFTAPDIFVSTVLDKNPNLLLYNLKLANLEIEKKLKTQYLLPKLDVKLNALTRNTRLFGLQGAYLLSDNYKVGLDFRYPIFTRSAKAEVEDTKIKIENLKLHQKEKSWEYSIKLQTFQNEYNLYSQQIDEVSGVVRYAYALLEFEKYKFLQGESTLFLINNRESKTVDARLKFISLKEKWLANTAKISWIAGEWMN